MLYTKCVGNRAPGNPGKEGESHTLLWPHTPLTKTIKIATPGVETGMGPRRSMYRGRQFEARETRETTIHRKESGLHWRVSYNDPVMRNAELSPK